MPLLNSAAEYMLFRCMHPYPDITLIHMTLKKSHFSRLARMAMVDGHIDEREKDLLFTLAAKLGLSQQEFADVLVNSHKIPFVAPTEIQERVEQLFELVHMMMADGTEMPEERSFCEEMALKLDFSAEHIPAIIDLIVAEIAASGDVSELMNQMQANGYL